MIAKLLLAIKHSCPWIWNSFEWINGQLFRLRASRLCRLPAVVESVKVPEGYAFSPVDDTELEALSEFLLRQGTESTRYFFPHYFDVETLSRLHRNPSFLMMKATECATGDIVGYFFLRCFVLRVCVAGLLVDEGHRGRGLGTAMWRCCTDLSAELRSGMFATISSFNEASLRSCSKGTRMSVRRHLKDDYMLIQCKKI